MVDAGVLLNSDPVDSFVETRYWIELGVRSSDDAAAFIAYAATVEESILPLTTPRVPCGEEVD
jgi:hypothetical protein